MTAIRFQINRETIMHDITIEEWEAMERAQDGDAKIYRLRPVLARFVVGEDGKLIPQEQALKEMGKIPFDEFMKDVFTAFFDALKDSAVPNASGSSSKLPSEASTPASPSPDGSQP